MGGKKGRKGAYQGQSGVAPPLAPPDKVLAPRHKVSLPKGVAPEIVAVDSVAEKATSTPNGGTMSSHSVTVAEASGGPSSHQDRNPSTGCEAEHVQLAAAKGGGGKDAKAPAEPDGGAEHAEASSAAEGAPPGLSQEQDSGMVSDQKADGEHPQQAETMSAEATGEAVGPLYNANSKLSATADPLLEPGVQDEEDKEVGALDADPGVLKPLPPPAAAAIACEACSHTATGTVSAVQLHGDPVLPSVKTSETDLLVLAAEVQRLEEALAESQLRCTDAEKRLEEAAMVLKEEKLTLEGELSVSRNVVTALKHDRAALEQQVKELKGKLDSAFSVARKEVRMEETDAVKVRMERAERALENERKARQRAEKLAEDLRSASQAGIAALEEVAALKEQLRDTQTELDAAQASQNEEAAKVHDMTKQLSALMAAGDLKLREHEEMAKEIALLREASSHAEGEKGPLLKQVERANVARLAAENRATVAESQSVDLNAKCEALGATLSRMVDENTELAELLNQRSAKAEEEALSGKAGDLPAGLKQESVLPGDQAREGAPQEASRQVEAAPELSEAEVQLLVLAEEVSRLEAALQEEHVKLKAMVAASAEDDDEIARLRVRVEELSSSDIDQAGPSCAMKRPASALELAIEADIESDRQHAQLLGMHREIANLRAQLADAQAKMAAAGLYQEPDPAKKASGYVEAGEVGACEGVRVTEGALSEGDEFRAAALAMSNAVEPGHSKHTLAQREEDQKKEALAQERANSNGGLWGFITGADQNEDLT